MPQWTAQFYMDGALPISNDFLGINNAGTVAGFHGTLTGNNVPYTVASPYSTFHEGTGSEIFRAINDKGVVVGYTSEPGRPVENAFYVKNGKTHFVTDPTAAGNGPDGSTIERLDGINDNGVAVGAWVDNRGGIHAFTYDMSANTFSGVSVKLFSNAELAGINNKGDMVGYGTAPTANTPSGTTVGFLDVGGHVTELLPPGAISSFGLGINNLDQVVGQYTDTAGVTHGFFFDPHTASFTKLDEGTSFGQHYTVATGINDKGVICGYSGDVDIPSVGFVLTPTGHR